MISLDITTNGAEITIPAGLEKLLSKENFRKFNEVGGRAAQQAAKKYHKEYNDAHLWRGPKYLGSGAGRAGEFGDEVTMLYQKESLILFIILIKINYISLEGIHLINLKKM
jgi:hypothetical protein